MIVFGDQESGRIMRVPAGGGTPAPVTARPAVGRRHAAPFFLSDGKRILFSDIATADAKDSRRMVQEFGPPSVPLAKMIEWTVDWLARDMATLNKPTHYEVRDGKY